ncbi:hypothetical protein R9X47_21730 [Wukongibacter baidiensis]|uniref:hypothetical protein n=1 Tax=Wukongibacter baidiensis TaxID=1723361 RepID=UPI003D7F8907
MYELNELTVIELALYRLKESEDKQDSESQDEINKVLDKVIKDYMETYDRLHN